MNSLQTISKPFHHRSLRTLTFVGIAFMLPTIHMPASVAMTISPEEGLLFGQLDLLYTNVQQVDSSYGLVGVDINKLTSYTGISSGYLNISTSSGWIVRNMPVDLSSGYPGISTLFDLGGEGRIESLEALVDFSATPSVSFPGVGEEMRFHVEDISYNAEGRGELRTVLPTSSVDTSVIEFNLGGLTSSTWQPGHSSIEQDTNQCGPAAVANSLQWLEDTYGINVPDNHVPGIRDESLVGQLDQSMGRQPHQTVNDLPFMQGKLSYIDDNDLADDLIIKYKDNGTFLPDMVTEGDATAKEDKSDLSITEWIHREIDQGENVELAVGWDGGGGHWVDLIGSGKVLGVPWVAWVHDAFQGFDDNSTPGNPNDDTTAENGGTNWFDGGIGWSPIIDDRLIVFIEGEFKAASVDLAVSESPRIPEPSTTLSLLTFGIIGAGSMLKRKLKPYKSN